MKNGNATVTQRPDFADTTGNRDVEVAEMLDGIATCYRVDGRLAGSTRIVDLLEFLASNGITG